METLTGGRLVARMLRKEGVSTVFTLSGLHVAPIYAGCVEEGIRLVDTRHEQAAAHAADAWARLTRGVGVAIVTAGPGRHRRGHRRRERLGGELAARPPRRRGADLQPGARLAPGDAAGAALPGHHQVVGPGPLPRPRPELPREGVPGGARRPARAGLPRAALGRALERRRRGARRGAGRATAPTRGSPAIPRRSSAALALLARAERPVLVGGSSVWWDDARGGARAARHRDRHPGLPERHGARLPPARPPLLLPALAQGGARGGGRGAGGRDAARLPRWATAPSPPSRPARRSSRWTWTPPRSAGTGPSRWASSATRGACSRRSPAARLAAGRARRGGRSCASRSGRASEKQRAFEESDQTPIHHFRLGEGDRDRSPARAGDVTFVGDGGNVVAVAAKMHPRCGGPGAGSTPARSAASASARPSPSPRSCSRPSGPSASSRATARSA